MKSRQLRCKLSEKDLTDNDIYNKCVKNVVRINKKIESGTYGVIYNAKYRTSRGMIDVAIKKVTENITGVSPGIIKRMIDNISKEIYYCDIVSKNNIGPILYDAFYIIERGDLTTYLIMELFDSSVEKLYYSNISNDILRNIHSQMIRLMKIQIYNLKMYCTDIKPENFVVKKIGYKYKVRSIDYGPDWCTLKKFSRSFKSVDFFYTIISMLLCLNIFSHIRQENTSILRPFFTDKIVINITENFKNFNKLKNVLINVIKDEDGEQIIFYFKDIVKEFTKIDYKDEEGIVNSIIFIYNQIYLSIFK